MAEIVLIGSLIGAAILGALASKGFERIKTRRTALRGEVQPIQTPPLSQTAPPPRELKVFRYLNVEQITQLYHQVARGLQLAEVEYQSTSAGSRGLGVAIPGGPEASLSREASDTAKERLLFDQSVVKMYGTVEEHLLAQSFCLDEFDAEEKTIRFVEDMFNFISERTTFIIPREICEVVFAGIRRDGALRRAETISRLKGFVRISGEFTVILAEGVQFLDFDHPLNRFLDAEDLPVSIRVVCDPGGFTSGTKNVIMEGIPFRLTCIGMVTSWDELHRQLVVSPIVIY